MVAVAGQVLDSNNAVIGNLADRRPGSEDILRLKFLAVTSANPTEIIDTRGYYSVVSMTDLIGDLPAGLADVGVSVRGSSLGGSSFGLMADQAGTDISFNPLTVDGVTGLWRPGYLVGLLPRYIQFGALAASFSLSLIIEFRKLRVYDGVAAAG